ncbi:hypothetical protein [Streptomyces malaysiense]|uniref:Uncharacterized protein n=1 Tax=Streptomyces malaysiense TaxID=1428626 RepID=A0A1J4PTY3_9ACTN|nr:hypothetical protein [Streptomyces malaysiense]OIK23574.1 hypothetical protein VT52_031835 [Streptomyces malaysiense]
MPFIAPVPAARISDVFHAGLDLDRATVVDRVPARDAHKDPGRRESYRVLEDVHVISTRRKSDPVFRLRRVLMHSTGNAAGRQAARHKRLACQCWQATTRRSAAIPPARAAIFSERRYSDIKGPLAVPPLFVQSNHRAAALIQVICLVLLVFCLIERQARRALGGEKKTAGLYPDSRRVRPTGRMVFYHLGELTVRTGSATYPPAVAITRGVQLHLLDLLGVDIRRTRRPQT